jgi:hypothetical protein
MNLKINISESDFSEKAEEVKNTDEATSIAKANNLAKKLVGKTAKLIDQGKEAGSFMNYSFSQNRTDPQLTTRALNEELRNRGVNATAVVRPESYSKFDGANVIRLKKVDGKEVDLSELENDKQVRPETDFEKKALTNIVDRDHAEAQLVANIAKRLVGKTAKLIDKDKTSTQFFSPSISNGRTDEKSVTLALNADLKKAGIDAVAEVDGVFEGRTDDPGLVLKKVNGESVESDKK